MRDTSHVGEVSHTQVMAALVLAGRRVLVPLGDHLRYDLVIDDGGVFLRVQCKTGRLTKGAILFHTCSIDSRSKQGGLYPQGLQGRSRVVRGLLSGS
jgi:hypothetical protein